MAKKKTAMTRGVMGSEEANRKLDALGVRIDKCKRGFDQYFNGLEKKPPLREYEQIKREIRSLQKVGYATATLRFKVQNMIARWQVMSALWDRNLQKLERGDIKFGVGARPSRGSKELKGGRGIADLKRGRRR